MQLSTIITVAAFVTLNMALGTNALPATSAATSSSNSKFVCDKAATWRDSRLSIRSLSTNAKTQYVNGFTDHNSRGRLAIASAPSYTADWRFYTCKGPGVPTSSQSNGAGDLVYGRLYSNGTGLCASVDSFPATSERQVIWEKVCATDATKATKQLFSYSPSNKELLFVGELPANGSKGVYVIDTHVNNYIPDYPTTEIAVRHTDTYSGKHYILKRVPS
ncbi:hypothetical protein A4X06_0g3158 [Tilletia controversa]|uniref:Uncharacterized protein n=1 Tax=Tilletia controversa TaxID=13291 RepID=A0A8X7MWB4_9BASI|nr:hypothetical protein CF328_g3416 [Tilletia controversa]KAE8249606.1 hypothetical protein A4X06_0g3158 [Tilletia controversa]